MTKNMISLEAIWPDWKIASLLGKGSYGSVYLIRRVDNPDVTAALKIIEVPGDRFRNRKLKKEDLEYIKNQVEEEIHILLRLKGLSNITSIEDYKILSDGNQEGWTMYIRMELLTPMDLDSELPFMTPAETIHLGNDICSALEICAQENLIHRDIKPENIFRNSHGDYKLGDFGIARHLGLLDENMTSIGTEPYMAPEVRLQGSYDTRADLYSLGIVLYRLLNNGVYPFMDPTRSYSSREFFEDRERSNRKRYSSNEPLPEPLNGSADLKAIVLKACDPDPNRRFQSAKAMKNALAHVSSNSSVSQAQPEPSMIYSSESARPTGFASKNPGFSEFETSISKGSTGKKKRAVKAAAIAVPICLLLAGIGGWFYFSSRSSADPAEFYLKKAKTYAESEDYEQAIAVLDQGLEKHPDSSQLKEDKKTYENRSTETAEQAVLKSAKDLADKNDYSGAIRVLDEAIAKGSASPALQQQKQTYESEQIASIKDEALKEANELAAVSDYKQAISVLDDAIGKIGADSALTDRKVIFTAKLEENEKKQQSANVQNQQPVYITIPSHPAPTAPNTNTPVQEPASNDSSASYYFPNSGITPLRAEEIATIHDQESFDIALNEIYARHGRKFQTEWIRNYFQAQPWYTGSIEPDVFDANTDSYLNATEQANIRALVEYGKQNGFR